MVHLNPLGRNWGDLVNWDSLGKFYASFAIVWTVILYTGATWLYLHRQVPYLKMRNIPLALTAVTFLHVYLVKILLAYTTNGHFPCNAEFWIMSIYLPFGIAFFQANLSQLLSVATQQRRLLEGRGRNMKDPRAKLWNLKGLVARWRAHTPLKRTYVCIGIGMVCQVVVTAAIYGTNKKLQGHWGTLTKAKGQAQCRKGLEWIPSAMWQLFFCCIYGPYLLYKIRHVRDTHFWRLQVMCCVISGFPGAPLWLASVFSTAFKPVNKWWVPPLWLAPGIIVMQAVTIFFPIYEHHLTLRLSSRNLSLLAMLSSSHSTEKWDTNTHVNTSTNSQRHTHSRTNSHSAPHSSNETNPYLASAEMYTLAALEKALTENPGPLLTFAATKDFTAESIIFLIAVRNFRTACGNPDVEKQELWRQAREIYTQSVSEKTAEFPINIDGNIREKLDRFFASNRTEERADYRGQEAWEREREEQVDKISPFANVSASEVPLSPMKGGSWGFGIHTQSAEMQCPLTPATTHSNAPTTPTRKNSEDGGWEIDEMPLSPRDLHKKPERWEGDGGKAEGVEDIERIFDAAERSIKYLVVTNTWRTFVTASKNKRSERASLQGLA